MKRFVVIALLFVFGLTFVSCEDDLETSFEEIELNDEVSTDDEEPDTNGPGGDK